MKYFDLHCDTVGRCFDEKKPLKNNDFHISIEKANAFENYSQVFAIWLRDELSNEEAYEYFLSARQNALNEFDKNKDIINLCSDVSAFSDKKSNAVFSVENSKLLDNSLQRIDEIYALGVRLMTLTWNAENCLASGVGSGSDDGLKPFGKQAVRKMNEKKIAVDVSHLNDAGFYDVAKTAQAPFLASHSNARSVCGHARNLTDDMIKIISSNGGIIGLNLSVNFLSDDGKAGLSDILAHVNYILNIGGEEVLALGADYDGTDVPIELSTFDKIPILYDFLSKNGLGKSLCDKIFYKNAFNYFTNRL